MTRPASSRATRQSLVRLGGLLLALVVGTVASPPAFACSVCRCGDPAFEALGLSLYEAGAFRLAMDWDRLAKEQGGPGERDSLVENRLTSTLSLNLSETVAVVVRVPYSRRELSEHSGGEVAREAGSEHGESATGSGLGDPELMALVRLWASPFGPLGRRAWVGAGVGVKTPWGDNDLSQFGERLDEHAQPGTGSTDVFAGLSSVLVIDTESSIFGSLQHRWTGSNPHDYRYGAATLVNLGFERRLGRSVDGVVEVNARSAARDRVDATGQLEPDTGGKVAFLAPRVVVSLGRGLVARAGVQIPILDNLNGEQDEKAVYGVGLTYLFSR